MKISKHKTRRGVVSFIILLVWIVVFCFIGHPIIAHAAESSINQINSAETSERFNEVDVLVAVALHIRCEPILNRSVRPVKIKPLYNLLDRIIAYDVTMSDGSYFVVNANKDNPMIIEFADSRLQTNERTARKEYYLAPGITSEKISTNTGKVNFVNSQYTISSQSTELIRLQTVFCSILSTQNRLLSNQHAILKNALTTYMENTQKKNKDPYDFLISAPDMPSGEYTEDLIPDIKNITPYGTTSEFDGVHGADNHCAATSAFNMVLYYRHIIGSSISPGDRNTVFTAIHTRIKNGPVTPTQYRNRLKKYIEQDTPYKITVENIGDTWINYKNEIDNDRMNVMCVWPSLFSAHMINGVGTRIYSTGTNYCVVLNNWWSASRVYTIFGTALYDLSKVYIYNS